MSRDKWCDDWMVESVSNKDKPGSLAPATGSLPVSSEEVLRIATALEEKAKERDRASRACDLDNVASVQRSAVIFLHCARLLRHAVAATERQPEENTKVSHGGSAPLAVTHG